MNLRTKLTLITALLLHVSLFAQDNASLTQQNSAIDSIPNNILAKDTSFLNEVAVGYGTRKKSHNALAISQVEGKAIAALQSSRIEDALVGKMAGLLIQNQDGAPGASSKIQIRSASNVTTASHPLIIVDGYPIFGSLATVNPNDIQSLEVLKGAASSAIYGLRGANGVILITTKKGKSGKASINYNAYLSTSSRYVRNNINPSAAEWANTVETNVANGTFDISEMNADLYNFKINALKNAPDVVAVEDWLFQNGNSMNHDLNVSGGTDNVDYFASVGYLNTKGIVQTQGFTRYNARLNFNAKLGRKFKMGVNGSGYQGDRDLVGHDQMDLVRAYSIHPIYHTVESIAFVQNLDGQAQDLGLAPFDEGYRGEDAPFNNSIYTLEPGMTAQDWHYGRQGNGIGGSGDAGPATKLDNTDKSEKTLFGNLSAYLQYSLIEGLNLKTVYGVENRDFQYDFWRGLEFDARGRGSQSRLQQINKKMSSSFSETTLSYTKKLAKHHIDAIAGIDFQKFYTDESNLSGTNLPYGQAPDFAIIELASISVSGRKKTVARRSIFGRINYAYDNRYLASMSVRRDANSIFQANNRFQFSPAFSLGWNVHNEVFYTSDFLSNLKLRYSYGSISLGPYSSFSLLNPTAALFGTGFLIPTNLTNPDLTGQTNKEMNYGIDLGFLKNRFSLTLDYYRSNIEGLLINQTISGVFDITSITLNAGGLRSSGMEFELGAKLIQTNNLRWNISANFSTVTTKITDLGGLNDLAPVIYGQSDRGPVFRNYVGGEIGEMWGVETIGTVEMEHLSNPLEYPGQQSGYSYVVDQQAPGEEGHGVIDARTPVSEGGDLVKIGKNTPDFYWGLNTNLRYKNFDASLQFQGVQDAQVYNIDPIYYGSQWGRPLQADFDANNDGIADHNGLPYNRNRDQTDAMLQDASYIALRNVTLGYSIDSNVFSKMGKSSLRVYLAATNLLYIMADDYTSFNPEGVNITNNGYLGPTTYGVQTGASPIVRSFTFGVNLSF